jgi:hypothetical protein
MKVATGLLMESSQREAVPDVSELISALGPGSSRSPGMWSMIAAYFDESGSHDSSVAVAFGGYSGTPEVWESLERQWRECLYTHGRLPFFHMADFVARVKPFDKLSDNDRNDLVPALVGIINTHDVAGTAIALKRADFGVVMPGVTGRAADPYYLLMMRAMIDVLLYAHARQERVLFTFDRRQKVAELAGILHDAMLHVHPWLKKVLSDQTVFASKEAQIRLQAADLLAYESYRRACDFSAPERKSFTALRQSFGELTVMSIAELAFYSIDPRIQRVVEEIIGLA